MVHNLNDICVVGAAVTVISPLTKCKNKCNHKD